MLLNIALGILEDKFEVKRHPKNADGDFYTTGHLDTEGEWCSDCLFCGLPQKEAPDLIAPIDESNTDTYFLRQPKSPEELERAIASTEVCCVDAVRYGGKDKSVLKRIHSSLCDYRVTFRGKVVPAKHRVGS